MDINEIQNIVEDDGIIFLTYGGFLSQSLIASMTEAFYHSRSRCWIVSRDNNGNYFIDSRNIISREDKDKIEPKLIEIDSLDLDGIKKRYKELRRSGKNTHGKGGGIGFYEIAKRCDKIEYDFKEINENKFYFHIKTKININK